MRQTIGDLHVEDVTLLDWVKTASNPTQVDLDGISIIDVTELLILTLI